MKTYSFKNMYFKDNRHVKLYTGTPKNRVGEYKLSIFTMCIHF